MLPTRVQPRRNAARQNTDFFFADQVPKIKIEQPLRRELVDRPPQREHPHQTPPTNPEASRQPIKGPQREHPHRRVVAPNRYVPETSRQPRKGPTLLASMSKPFRDFDIMYPVDVPEWDSLKLETYPLVSREQETQCLDQFFLETDVYLNTFTQPEMDLLFRRCVYLGFVNHGFVMPFEIFENLYPAIDRAFQSCSALKSKSALRVVSRMLRDRGYPTPGSDVDQVMKKLSMHDVRMWQKASSRVL